MIAKVFLPGDEWVYFKIYCGIKIADDFLLKHIRELSNKWISEDLIESWFFVRYNDNGSHLRIRFKLRETNNYGLLVSQFSEKIRYYYEKRAISKFYIDTYTRELDRYGKLEIELFESLFFIQSEFVLDILNECSFYTESEEIRWYCAIKSVNETLKLFEYGEESRINLCEDLKKSYDREFFMNKALKIQIDTLFRRDRKLIDKYIKNDILGLEKYFNKYCLASERILKKININKKYNNNMIWDIIHMLMNKWFRTEQRKHEMLIYNLLYRYLKSEKARVKYSKVD